MEITSKSLSKTDAAAKAFLKEVSRLPQKDALTVGLRGNLGSGKTTFVQAIARELGVVETVTSPTFVILKKYSIPKNNRFETLVHMDAYRLEEPKELKALGFAEEVANPTNILLVEWPENISEALPPDITMVDFEFVDEGVRKIHWTQQ